VALLAATAYAAVQGLPRLRVPAATPARGMICTKRDGTGLAGAGWPPRQHALPGRAKGSQRINP